MKNFLLMVFCAASIMIIGCKPSEIVAERIVARFSYTSDPDAIQGILFDVLWNVGGLYFSRDSFAQESKSSVIRQMNIAMTQIEDSIPRDDGGYDALIYNFEESTRKKIENYFKKKYGSQIRSGEVLKIEYDLLDDKKYDVPRILGRMTIFIYRPYNAVYFPEKLISYIDFYRFIEKADFGSLCRIMGIRQQEDQ